MHEPRKHSRTNSPLSSPVGAGHGSRWSAVRLRASLMTVLFAILLTARFRRWNLESSFELAIAVRMVCEGMLPVETRTQLGESTTAVVGQDVGLFVCGCVSPVESSGDQSKPKNMGKGKGKKEGMLHPLGPLCRQRRRYDQAPP